MSKREKNIKHPPAVLVCDCGQSWFPPDMVAYIDHLRTVPQEQKGRHCWWTESILEPT